ncbi:hypothetical protein FOZ63_017986, partial [Perkinsus olseni]
PMEMPGSGRQRLAEDGKAWHMMATQSDAFGREWHRLAADTNAWRTMAPLGSRRKYLVSLPGVLTASHIEVEAADECVRIRHNPPFSGHRKYRALIIWFPTRFAGGVQ